MLIRRMAAPALIVMALCAAAYCEEKSESTEKAAEPAAAAKPAEPAPATEAKATESKSTTAKDFALPDAEGKKHSLADYKGKIVVLEWTNSECPFVQRYYKSGASKKLAAKYADKGVVWLAVNSTKTNKPEDSKSWSEKQSVTYPTLQDPEGTVGHLYGAKTTPHIFIVGKDGNVAYQGAATDDANGEKGDDAKDYVDAALTKMVAGEKPEIAETKSWGCSVKYKN